MENQLFQLRMTAKQLSRESSKSEKAAKSNQDKCKKAMEKQNMDGARIYAESAIREKNQALNYLRLSNRIDAVAQRVNTAIKLNTLTKSMSGVVKGMDVALQSMNVEKISAVMDKFEKQFEDLDVSSKVMEQSMSTSTAQSMPMGQVDALMQQVADEHGLEFQSQLEGVGVGKTKKEAEAGKEPTKKVAAVATVGAGGAGGGGGHKGGSAAGAAGAAAAGGADAKHNNNNNGHGGGADGGHGGGGGGGGGAAVPVRAKPAAATLKPEAPAAPEPAHDKPMTPAEEDAALEARLKALQD